MAKKRPLNLPQLAFAHKSGNLKIEDMPERIKGKVQRFASEHTLDSLKAMATPTVRPVRQVGAAHPFHLRKVRSA